MTHSLQDILWIMTCAGLVFGMQAGFACLESGLTRSKNSINVAVKNLTDFGLSVLLFWLIGYGIMFGRSEMGWWGVNHFTPLFNSNNGYTSAFFLFQAMFCATAVTIISGAVAERLRFSGYIVIAIIISGFVYPMFGHWTWNGLQHGQATGWLGQLGFIDFAGSTVVHGIGGWAALAVAIIIGPRLGRFQHDNQHAIKMQGSNITLAILGALFLWLGWFGFNGGSVLAMNHSVPLVITNTIMAGATGAITGLGLGYLIEKFAKIDYLINGSLAGLVAITAGVHAVTTIQAIAIGCIGASVMVVSKMWLERVKIDDAIDAIPVHLFAGIWGTCAVAIFCDPDILGTGLSRWEQFKVQVMGILACGVLGFGLPYIFIKVVNRKYHFRVTPEQEKIGLNVTEHGAASDLVDAVTTMSHQAKSKDLSQRLDEDLYTEIGQIAICYNQVLDSLEAARSYAQEVVNGLKEGLISFDRHGMIVDMNPASKRLLGINDMMQGKPIADLFLKSDLDTMENVDLLKSYAKKERLSVEQMRAFHAIHKSGHLFPVEMTISISHDSGEPIYTMTFHDISELVEIENKLRLAVQDAQRATRAKSEFLANMSHEIRTPMNAILGFSEELLSTELDLDQKDVLQIIYRSGTALLRIINDILDFSKIEAGKMELDHQPFVLKHLLDDVSGVCLGAINEKKIDYVCINDCHESTQFMGDAPRLRQVLINLIGNATKFTEAGEIRVSVEVIRQDSNEAVLKFSVQDTGIGIPEDKQKGIFEEFEQADGSTTRKYGGTGLGLAISRRIIQLMAGQLSLKSQENVGSEFYFSIRLPKVESMSNDVSYDIDLEQPTIDSSGCLHVLLVEDNIMNQKLILKILQALKHDVSVANHGQEAVQTVLDDPSIDLVFMDIQMPIMNGLEATQKIRAAGYHDLPIVALTANAFDEDRENCLNAGMNEFLTKPIDRQKLLAMIQKFSGKQISK